MKLIKLTTILLLLVTGLLIGCSQSKEVDKKIPRVTSVTKADKPLYINFQYTDVSNWPTEFSKEKKKYVQGWITVNGKNVERFWVGMHLQHLNNVYGKEYHVPGLKTGEKAKIGLRSTDGKFEAAPFDFVWPFKGT